MPRLYTISSFHPRSSAVMVGEDRFRFSRFIRRKMMMLAAPRQNWKRETWALFMGLPPDKAESRTSADTPMVTDSIITPLIMTNMDSSWKYP